MKPKEHEKRFVAYLQSLAQQENRGALAALRRGSGKPPGAAPEMFPWVVPHLPNLSRRESEAFFLVAALWGLHPSHTDQGNLGTTLRQVAEKAPQGRESTERRFVALLNACREDLPSHLRHVIRLAAAKEVPVNWTQLLADLRAWHWSDRPVQRAWAQEFWRQVAPGQAPTEQDREQNLESEG